jgi:hypothetical protein
MESSPACLEADAHAVAFAEPVPLRLGGTADLRIAPRGN